MQSVLGKLLPGTFGTPIQDDADSRGFELADTIEGGAAHEVLADYQKASGEPELYLIRKGSDSNEWTLLDYRSMKFLMRAKIEVEFDNRFTSNFDPKVLASRDHQGRMRVGIYLSQPELRTGAEADPAVVLISDFHRSTFRAYKVVCDSCRYRRRSSTFMEGFCNASSGSDSSPLQKSSSPCSYVSHSAPDDFVGLCSVVPSGQELLRMTHTPVKVHLRDFTQISVCMPASGTCWCPVDSTGRRTLGDRNTSDPVSVFYESKLPVWSESLQALALEFRQREVLPSRRNFQLVSKHKVFQHYRTGKNEYMMELGKSCDDMSLVQAFCIALSSALWR